MQLNLFKKNRSTFFFLIFIILGLFSASFYFFKTFLSNQIHSHKDYLGNLVKAHLLHIQNETTDFEKQIDHYVLEKITNSPIEEMDNKNWRELFENEFSLLDTITIYTPHRVSKFWISKQHQLNSNVEISEIKYHHVKEKIGNKPKLAEGNFERSTLYSGPNCIVRIHLNLNKLLSFSFREGIINDENFYGYFNGKKLLFFPDNMKDVSLTVSNKVEQEIEQAVYNFKAYQDEVFIEFNGVSTEMLIAVQPVMIAGNRYGIIVGQMREPLITRYWSTFKNLMSISVLIITLIIIVFILNITSVRNASKQLWLNEKLLSDMVKQQKLLLEHSNDFTFKYNRQREYTFVSENVSKVLGFTPLEYKNPRNRVMTSNTLNIKAEDLSNKLLDNGQEIPPYYIEVINKAGKPRILEIIEKPIVEKNIITGVIGLAKDVTSKYHTDLKFRIVFEYSSIPNIILVQDRIVDINNATLKFFNEPLESNLMGKTLSNFSSIVQANTDKPNEFLKQQLQIAYTKGKAKFDWILIDSKGKEKPVEISFTKVVLNETSALLGVFHDLEERKKTEQALIHAKQKAEELARQKEQFLSSMSHEIRTPLSAVIGYTRLLLEEDPKEDQIEKLNSLQFASNSLLNLVNDILDHSKIEYGTITLSEVSFKLRQDITDLKNSISVKAKEKHIDLKLEIEETLPKKVIGDLTRFNQILMNLLSNAIKFTPEYGEVLLEVYTPNKEDVYDVFIKVSDNGIGIKPENHKRIFEPFQQANDNILNDFGGTGLGLFITKKLVELLGGHISVSSELGKGAVFTCNVKFKEKKEKIFKEETSENQVSSQKEFLLGKKILLVEDNIINQKIASQLIKRWGAEIEIAHDGLQGVQKIKEKGYYAVLMDIQMPRMDGYKASSTIRKMEDDYFKTIPIIALTADAFVEKKEKSIKAGMTDFVTKPINPSSLKTVLKKYLY